MKSTLVFGSSTMVEFSPNQPKVKGLTPALGEKNGKKEKNRFKSH